MLGLARPTVEENEAKLTECSHLCRATVYGPARHALLSHGDTVSGAQQWLNSCLDVRPTKCRIEEFKSLLRLHLDRCLAYVR
jgi:hypothetical protein